MSACVISILVFKVKKLVLDTIIKAFCKTIYIFDSDLVWRMQFNICREFLNLSYQIWVEFIFVYQKSLKRPFKTSFWVQNYLLNLCYRAVNSQRLLCSQKFVVKYLLKLSGKQKKLHYTINQFIDCTPVVPLLNHDDCRQSY